MVQRITSREISSELASLSSITKKDLVKKLTEEPFKQATINVLCGKNLRDFTESLTRERLSKAYLYAFENFLFQKKAGYSAVDISERVLSSLKSDSKGEYRKEEKTVLQWMIGLTGKLVQNVLRDKKGKELEEYTNKFIQDIKKNSKELNYKLIVESKDGDSLDLDMGDLVLFMNMIGSLTLTIRGSEKSLHGKTFEKLILGSVFQILGFNLVRKNDISSYDCCFWLSSKAGGRESDATLIYKNKGIRVDIGFIGRGNTEITLDKVSRYRKKAEIKGSEFEMETIILVDVVGDRSQIDVFANAIDGIIFRMSEPNWVISLSEKIKEIFKTNEIGIPENLKETKDVHNYIKQNINKIDFNNLLNL